MDELQQIRIALQPYFESFERRKQPVIKATRSQVYFEPLTYVIAKEEIECMTRVMDINAGSTVVKAICPLSREVERFGVKCFDLALSWLTQ